MSVQGREAKSGTSAREKFSPSGRGGHKNSGNAATFPEFLGGRTNFSLARRLIGKSAPARGHLRHAEGSFYPQFLVEPLTNHLGYGFYLKARQTRGGQPRKRYCIRGIPRNSPSFHRLSPNTLSWGAGVERLLGVVFTSSPKCGGIKTTLMLFFE